MHVIVALPSCIQASRAQGISATTEDTEDVRRVLLRLDRGCEMLRVTETSRYTYGCSCFTGSFHD